MCIYIYIRDDIKQAQLLRALNCQSEVVGSILAKPKKTENSNLHKFELHRPSSKGTKSLFQVKQGIINQNK